MREGGRGNETRAVIWHNEKTNYLFLVRNEHLHGLLCSHSIEEWYRLRFEEFGQKNFDGDKYGLNGRS